MTKGGDNAVTTRNTVRARVDTAATERSPPGHIIVSKRTDRPDTKPTRFHLTLETDVTIGGASKLFKNTPYCMAFAQY